jgi:hypothetical protein
VGQRADGLTKTHPFTVRQPQDNTYGMMLYSRLELLRPEVRFLVEDDIPSMRALVRLPAGTEVEIYCLHPRPPVPQESPRSTERDAELMVVGKETKGKAAADRCHGRFERRRLGAHQLFISKESAACSIRASAAGFIIRFTPIISFCAFRSTIFFTRITLDSSN